MRFIKVETMWQYEKIPDTILKPASRILLQMKG